MRYTKAHRLRRRREYLGLAARGRKLYTRDFVIYWAPRSARPSRLGVTITKKVAGSVGRSRIKRLVRESFRTRQAGFEPAVDLSVIAKRSAAGIDFHNVDHQLARALGRIAGA